ncbi:uncharacterized protein ARMOST_02623 [Armillaria ostoyae]|uniref:Uncharacterized protein n=1 Tax=Armillaria ostoyae TaxID=47428 RepID=A0A284QS80_ARMOS|nr:uncharacterized protein ARMOST_02623 [Armillaria ostoyae]
MQSSIFQHLRAISTSVRGCSSKFAVLSLLHCLSRTEYWPACRCQDKDTSLVDLRLTLVEDPAEAEGDSSEAQCDWCGGQTSSSGGSSKLSK